MKNTRSTDGAIKRPIPMPTKKQLKEHFDKLKKAKKSGK